MSVSQRSVLLISMALLGIAACDSGNDITEEPAGYISRGDRTAERVSCGGQRAY